MEVVATGDGASPVLTLGEGTHVVGIEATTWDGASAKLQESVNAEFSDSDDPYNTGNPIVRTSAGNVLVILGGVKLRLLVSNYGASTSGLKLIANRSGINLDVAVPVNANSLRTERNAEDPIVVRKSANFVHLVDNLGELVGVNRLVFTLKNDLTADNDAASSIQISTSIPADSGTDGILVLAGAPGGNERTSGAIAIESYTAGETTKYRVRVTIKDTATNAMATTQRGTYDLKYFTSDGSFILDEGPAVVEFSTSRVTT